MLDGTTYLHDVSMLSLIGGPLRDKMTIYRSGSRLQLGGYRDSPYPKIFTRFYECFIYEYAYACVLCVSWWLFAIKYIGCVV